jgi:hypothetical protein
VTCVDDPAGTGPAVLTDFFTVTSKLLWLEVEVWFSTLLTTKFVDVADAPDGMTVAPSKRDPPAAEEPTTAAKATLNVVPLASPAAGAVTVHVTVWPCTAP